jgi:mono/diheme cytochrome c family protein
MKAKLLPLSLFAATLFGGAALLSGCNKTAAAVKSDETISAYDTEADWNDAAKLIRLDYQQAQGKRIFYQYCVWCHADATPAGPSNRSNLTPVPPLLNDGEKLNSESDDALQKVITLGGAATGKSPMMPPYGKTLAPADIKAVIAFARAVAQPAYAPSEQSNAAAKAPAPAKQ